MSEQTQSELDKEIAEANKNTFLNNIRIVQGMSKLVHVRDETGKPKFAVGDMALGSGEGAINLGNKAKIIIGPWRYAARSFQNENLVEQSFNIMPASVYDPVTNTWNHPGKSVLFDKLLNASRAPQTFGVGVNTMVGFDVLVFLPDFETYAVFFFAKTALKPGITNAFDVMKNNKGRVAELKSALRTSKSASWYVPEVNLLVGEPENFVEDQEQIKLFINPGTLDVPLLTAGATADRPR